jgi:hypothetical protein
MRETYKDFIGIYENAVPVEFCRDLINLHKNADVEEKWSSEEKYGGALNRKDEALQLEDYSQQYLEEVQKFVFEYLELYKKKYFSYYECKHIDYTAPFIKVQKTEPQGGYHIWHYEVDSIQHVSRSLVWMIYLNDVPKGEGETEFLWQGLRIQPKRGTLLIWPAQFTHTHRGNPVYNCTKYVATGWIEYADLYDGEVEELYRPEGDGIWAYRTCDNGRDELQSNKEKPYKRFTDLN